MAEKAKDVKSSASKLPVGIDLGTTQSCVAVYFTQEECARVLMEQLSRLQTVPSCVEYRDENHVRVGEKAKFEPKIIRNAIYDTKRIIGRNFNDPNIQKFISKWNFELKNTENRPEVVINVNNTEKAVCPTYVHSRIIDRMATMARGFQRLNTDERLDVVITVPTYFNDAQRQETMRAAHLANVNVLSLINEPTAAALAYGFDKTTKITDKGVTVLIYDFGGGTIDLSILSIKNHQYKVLGTYGDTSIGGRDLDEAITDYVLRELNRLTGSNLSNDKHFRLKLLQSCERAKIALSEYDATKIEIPDLTEYNLPDEINFDREKLIEIADDLFKRALMCIDQVLKNADMTEDDIDEIIIIGGMAKIPIVSKEIENRFSGKKINRIISEDHAIAIGAAYYAARLSKNPDNKVSEINIT